MTIHDNDDRLFGRSLKPKRIMVGPLETLKITGRSLNRLRIMGRFLKKKRTLGRSLNTMRTTERPLETTRILGRFMKPMRITGRAVKTIMTSNYSMKKANTISGILTGETVLTTHRARWHRLSSQQPQEG